jgi:ketosteroid isomerase-like protein
VTTPDVRVVGTWHEALNVGDVERLLELSNPDVEVGGPRGAGCGTQLLREWVSRANIRLEPRRFFHRAGTVVAEEDAEWRDDDTGEMTGNQTVGIVFTVRDGRVASVLRYPCLSEALSAANLDDRAHEKRAD